MKAKYTEDKAAWDAEHLREALLPELLVMQALAVLVVLLFLVRRQSRR